MEAITTRVPEISFVPPMPPAVSPPPLVPEQPADTAAPAQHLKDLPGVERLTALVFRKLHAQSLEEGEKHHLFPFRTRALILLVAIITCTGAGGAGALAAYINNVVNVLAAEQVQSDSSVLYYVVTVAYSILWSILEILLVYAFAVWGAMSTVRVFGLNLWPKEKERALVAGALSRAALELGFPEGRQMGVNPEKLQSKLLLLLTAVLFIAKRGIVKFFLKFLVKKLGPRLTLKSIQEADDWIQIVVNVVMNFFTTWLAMSEVKLVCLGPPAVDDYLKQVMEKRRTWDVPLEDSLKLAAMRVVGVTVCNKECMHPNLRYALSAMAKEWVDDEGDFIKKHGCFDEGASDEVVETAPKRGCCQRSSAPPDVEGPPKPGCLAKCRSRSQTEQLGHQQREDLRMKPLRLDDKTLLLKAFETFQPGDQHFLLAIGVLASCLDGRASYRQLLFLREMGTLCTPARRPSAAAHGEVRRRLMRGVQIEVKDLLAVMDGTGGAECLFPWQGEFYMVFQAAVAQYVDRTSKR